MTLSPTTTLSDISSVITVILVAIGGCFTYYQWKKSNALKRAEYINELTEKIRTDKHISDAIYIIDYKQNWYDKDFHENTEIELGMDKTLSYFSYICYLKNMRIISNKEFKFFDYEVTRILQNAGVQNYFYNLYHFSQKFKKPFTFYYLFKYGEQKKFFDADFYDKQSYETNYKYTKILNF